MTTYLVREWRGGRPARELGRTEAAVPRQALRRLAPDAVRAGWPYEDHADGSGGLVDPADPDHRIVADPVFPDD